MLIPEDPRWKEIKLQDSVSYECVRCGRCCRHVRDSVPADSLDLYRMAKTFEKHEDPEDAVSVFVMKNVHLLPITESGFPVTFFNTKGLDDSCIFLQDGNICTVQKQKPRACRIYPLAINPDSSLLDFEYAICTENPHHFTGNKVAAKNWFHRFLNEEDRSFLRDQANFALQTEFLLRRIPDSRKRIAIMLIMKYQYILLDVSQPFLPQYRRNSLQLFHELEGLTDVSV